METVFHDIENEFGPQESMGSTPDYEAPMNQCPLRNATACPSLDESFSDDKSWLPSEFRRTYREERLNRMNEPGRAILSPLFEPINPGSFFDNSPSDHFDVTLSFSCGGWFQMYFFGAAHALVDSGVLARWRNEGKRIRFTGSSAGSLAALCLASGEHDFEHIRDYAAAAAQDFRSSIFHLFKMKQYLRDSIREFGKNLQKIDTDGEVRSYFCSGAVEVAVTRMPRMQEVLITRFPTFDHLEEAVLASCCMVPFVGLPFRMRTTGYWVVDGGFASFTPRAADPNCLSVSAMYFQQAHVHPHTFVPSWWAIYPPDDNRYRNLFWMGYNDMIDHLVVAGHVSAEHASELLKPETDFHVHDSIFDVIFTIVMEAIMMLVVRPFAVLCIYVELVLSVCFYVVKSLFLLDRGSLRRSYDNLRNTVSLRTLFRLVFGERVPSNEERLSKGSHAFRIFAPVSLGRAKKTGRECYDSDGAPLKGRPVPSLSPTARKAGDFGSIRTGAELPT